MLFDLFCLRLRATVAVLLSLSLSISMAADQSAPAALTPPPNSGKSAVLQSDEKILQALNRFTYGPRPGDLEKIRAIGLQEWFNQQLAPQKIDDSLLDRRLAAYPAMRMPLEQLMETYPNQQTIRREVNGRFERPGGEAEKAIYNDAIARYKDKLAKKNAANPTTDGEIDTVTSLPEDAPSLIAMPPDQRFSALCRFTPQQLRALRKSTGPDDRRRLLDSLTPLQLEALAAFQTPQGVITAEAIQTKLLRDLYGERQLNEVMVDFWLNHFNVYIRKSQDAPYYIAAYDRDSIRPYALSSFENLLVATATSPAMLNYLDNASSIGPHSQFAQRPVRALAAKQKKTGLNENYARELMELHTLGVNGGYTQNDVTEVAKVFTGWTVGSPERNGIPAQPQFDSARHEPGKKTVLGVTIKENGEKEGLQVLHILATSPQTARFISTKLAVRFVSDDPPQPLVDRMTQTFLTTHGDIRRVLLAMINSPEFFARANYRTKVKTPQDFVISAVRASGAEVESAAALANVLAELGMPVYGMQTPNGYSMKADPWNSTASLIERLNFALALSANRVVGVHTDWTSFLNTSPGNAAADGPPVLFDPRSKERLFESRLLHIDVSDRTRSTILAQISSDPVEQQMSLAQVAVKDRKRDPLVLQTMPERADQTTIADPQSAMAAGLLFGSPEFQRR